jgi:putative ATP-dependent endonuclease of the OLD family
VFVNRLYIRNFRSIKKLDLSLRRGKNVIVGRNNAGKSNIVKTLDILLGESTPDYSKSENVGINDFHTCTPEGGDGVLDTAAQLFLWCELTREPGEALNYQELYKCYGFYRCCRDNRFGPPARFDTLPEDYADAFDYNEDECDAKAYINPKLRNQQTLEKEFEGMYRFAIGFKATREEGRVIKDARLFYRESESTPWIMSFKARVRTELLQSAIIPSFRDPQQQLRLTTWTWYGKLMRHLIVGHPQLPSLKEKFDEVHTVANQIFDGVRESVSKSSLEVAFPGTELFFHLNPDVQLEVYKACLIYVDDGFKSLLTEKGSGIQSATIIGLFTYYTQHVNTVTAALMCIEEPELYLHPHARRVISERLNDFIGTRNQVILTTHSAEFLQSDGAELNVIVVRHDRKRGTTSTTVDLRQYAGVLLDSKANEVFFADKVIVCEGFDDFVVRETARSLFPKELDAHNVSVISVGGKDNISTVVKLVLKLGLECYILADFDYLLRDKGKERIRYAAKAHESILSLGKGFFAQSCVCGAKGIEMYSRLQKRRVVLKRDAEEAFYKATRVDEIQDEDVPVLLQELRAYGVGLLSGQVEDLCIDGSLSASRKLSMERIFKLNRRLASGTPITDIFDVTDIVTVLSRVLQRSSTERTTRSSDNSRAVRTA